MKTALVLLCLAVSSMALPAARRQKRQAEEEAVLTFCREQLSLFSTQMFFADPEDCGRYYQCFQQGNHLLAANLLCPPNQIWFQPSLTCIVGSCAVSDPCALAETERIGYYASEASCAEFYQCNFGISVRQCCPANLGWNQTVLRCDDVTPCDQLCEVKPTELEVDEEELEEGQCKNGNYYYWAGSTPSAYKMLPVVHEPEEEAMEANCPAAAPTFDVAQCGCIGHDIQIFTESGSCLMFDYETEITPGQPAWVDNFGTEITDGAMCFSGQTYMQVPYYAAMDWSLSFSVQFKFTVDGDLPEGIQSLVSNGNPNSPASVLVQLNEGQMEVVLTPVLGEVCSVAVPAAAPGGDVMVTYDGKVGGAGLSIKLGEEEVTAACSGAIIHTPNPAYFGRDFVGCMDEIKICTQL